MGGITLPAKRLTVNPGGVGAPVKEDSSGLGATIVHLVVVDVYVVAALRGDDAWEGLKTMKKREKNWART